MSKISEAIEEFAQAMGRAPDWFQEVFGGSSMTEMLIYNGIQVIGIGLAGWLLATWFEHRHFKSMDQREIPLGDISTTTAKHPPPGEPQGAALLIGSVVVAHDYFRTVVIFFRRLIGGNIRPYERLVERGRREALIRLKEEADLRQCDKIINVRFATTAVSGRFLHAIEMVAYGTGVRTVK